MNSTAIETVDAVSLAKTLMTQSENKSIISMYPITNYSDKVVKLFDNYFLIVKTQNDGIVTCHVY